MLVVLPPLKYTNKRDLLGDERPMDEDDGEDDDEEDEVRCCCGNMYNT